MLYSLEVVILTTSQVNALEIAYKKILTDLQALSKNVASQAIYLLIGLLPFEAELHLRILTLWGAITRQPEGSAIRDLAIRKISVYNRPKDSWFTYALKVASKYKLTDLLHSSLDWTIAKPEWKQLSLKRCMITGSSG